MLGLAESFGLAFFKAQEATQLPLPLDGGVLITVADRDKPGILEPARLFKELNFKIWSTAGTNEYLAENGIETEAIKKIGYGRPHIVDAIKNHAIQLVINTPSGRESQEDDSYIRKSAIKYKVPYITTTAASLVAARGIAARRKESVPVRSLQDYHMSIK